MLALPTPLQVLVVEASPSGRGLGVSLTRARATRCPPVFVIVSKNESGLYIVTETCDLSADPGHKAYHNQRCKLLPIGILHMWCVSM